jgi:hypothetical protein
MDTNLRKQTTTDYTDGTDGRKMTRLRPAVAGLRFTRCFFFCEPEFD